MSSLECSICLDDFRKSKDVYSTDCGHIFHKQCLDRCKSNMSTFTCPQCRKPNPKSHKLFLNLEDTEKNKAVDQLKAELKLAELKLQEMGKMVQNDEDSETKNKALNSNFELKGIIMKGVSKADIKTPLIDTILMFANIMKVPCERSDIETVFVFDRTFLLRTQNHTDKLSIVVKFSTQEVKDLFLNNKNILSPQGITIIEYVDLDNNVLFEYAKSSLSAYYKHIFCRHNSIFVQKDDGDILHRICNKNSVDMLKSM